MRIRSSSANAPSAELAHVIDSAVNALRSTSAPPATHASTGSLRRGQSRRRTPIAIAHQAAIASPLRAVTGYVPSFSASTTTAIATSTAGTTASALPDSDPGASGERSRGAEPTSAPGCCSLSSGGVFVPVPLIANRSE